MKEFDWDAVTRRAWADLKVRLARHLAAADQMQTLVIELAPPFDDLAGASPYVQICVETGGGVRGEVSSNAYLDRRLELDGRREGDLVRFGWAAPTHGPFESGVGGSANFFIDGQLPNDADELAWLAVGALRHVFGVPDPAFLTAAGFGPDGPFDESDLDLGLTVVSPYSPGDDDEEEEEGDGPDLGVLRAAVDEAIAPGVGAGTGSEVTHDADGDVPIRCGSAVVFVRVEPDATVTLFSPLLADVAWSKALGDRLAALNRRMCHARMFFSDDTVYALIQLFTDPLVASHLRQALAVMTEIADDLDDELLAEFGGRTFFGDYQPPPGSVESNGGHL